MSQQDDRHSALIPKPVNQSHDCVPVLHREHIPLAVADRLDVLDVVRGAYLLPDQLFKPVCCIENERLVGVIFCYQHGEVLFDLIVGFRYREMVHLDVGESVLSDQEDWGWGMRGPCRFPDFLNAVEDNTCRLPLNLALYKVLESHCVTSSTFTDVLSGLEVTHLATSAGSMASIMRSRLTLIEGFRSTNPNSGPRSRD